MGMENLNTTENNWETTWTFSQGGMRCGVVWWGPEVEVIIPLSKCNVWWHFNFLEQMVLRWGEVVVSGDTGLGRVVPRDTPDLQQLGLFSLFVIIWACTAQHCPARPLSQNYHEWTYWSGHFSLQVTADLASQSNNNQRGAKINITSNLHYSFVQITFFNEL